jgi:cytochrome c oxidase assembly protein subunit 15
MSEFATPAAHRRQLAFWLFTVAGFVVLMVLVGGLTRLTDSGLSITEWQPITGVLPPLSAADWEVAFAKYREIPEYQLVNAGMSLEAFKVIYWWEWGHRQLGRVIGLVFFLPFVVFLLQRKIPKPALGPLLTLFALGGLQGFMGWYMVQSGLTDRVDVSQYRLAMHLGLALIIFSSCLWMGLHFFRDVRLPATSGPGVALSGIIVALVLVQSLLGALVAGLDAGTTYTDWPFMDGDIIPSGLFEMSPAVSNLFESHLTVQFNHRLVAYALTIAAIWHVYRLSRTLTPRPALVSGILLIAVILGQGVLGIVTLMNAVPLPLGAAHQLGAVLVLGLAVTHLHYMRFPEVVTIR